MSAPPHFDYKSSMLPDVGGTIHVQGGGGGGAGVGGAYSPDDIKILTEYGLQTGGIISDVIDDTTKKAFIEQIKSGECSEDSGDAIILKRKCWAVVAVIRALINRDLGMEVKETDAGENTEGLSAPKPLSTPPSIISSTPSTPPLIPPISLKPPIPPTSSKPTLPKPIQTSTQTSIQTSTPPIQTSTPPTVAPTPQLSESTSSSTPPKPPPRPPISSKPTLPKPTQTSTPSIPLVPEPTQTSTPQVTNSIQETVSKLNNRLQLDTNKEDFYVNLNIKGKPTRVRSKTPANIAKTYKSLVGGKRKNKTRKIKTTKSKLRSRRKYRA